MKYSYFILAAFFFTFSFEVYSSLHIFPSFLYDLLCDLLLLLLLLLLWSLLTSFALIFLFVFTFSFFLSFWLFSYYRLERIQCSFLLEDLPILSHLSVDFMELIVGTVFIEGLLGLSYLSVEILILEPFLSLLEWDLRLMLPFLERDLDLDILRSLLDDRYILSLVLKTTIFSDLLGFTLAEISSLNPSIFALWLSTPMELTS